MMKIELWKKIESFDLDSTPSDYPFLTRLAFENNWTIAFATQAIVEYKKFAYLKINYPIVATPSPIVETVWKTHLVDTQSYHRFCRTLGQEMPFEPTKTTIFPQKRLDIANFKNLYRLSFGEMPTHFWQANSDFEALELVQAEHSFGEVLGMGLLLALCAIVPAIALLQPTFLTILPEQFLVYYVSLWVIGGLFLYATNLFYLEKKMTERQLNPIIDGLTAPELMIMKTQKISSIVAPVIQELCQQGILAVDKHQNLQLLGEYNGNQPIKRAIILEMEQHESIQKTDLIQSVIHTPLVFQFANANFLLTERFRQSTLFVNLAIFNCLILYGMLIVGFVYLTTTFVDQRPVLATSVVLMGGFAFMLVFLYQSTLFLPQNILQNLYKKRNQATKKRQNKPPLSRRMPMPIFRNGLAKQLKI